MWFVWLIVFVGGAIPSCVPGADRDVVRGDIPRGCIGRMVGSDDVRGSVVEACRASRRHVVWESGCVVVGFDDMRPCVVHNGHPRRCRVVLCVRWCRLGK